MRNKMYNKLNLYTFEIYIKKRVLAGSIWSVLKQSYLS